MINIKVVSQDLKFRALMFEKSLLGENNIERENAENLYHIILINHWLLGTKTKLNMLLYITEGELFQF